MLACRLDVSRHRCLLQHRADPLRTRDEDARSAVHLAAQYGHHEVLRVLLDENAGVDQMDAHSPNRTERKSNAVASKTPEQVGSHPSMRSQPSAGADATYLHISAARRSICTISDPRHSRVPQRQLAAKLPCVPPSHPHESSPRTPGRKGEDAATC